MARPRPEGLDAPWVGTALRAMSWFNVLVFRSSGGRLGQVWVHGAPVCLLTTTGRTSGKPRTAPLVYLQDGERWAVVACRGGLPGIPHWFRNLQADPRGMLQIGRDSRPVKARVASAEERAPLWRRLTRVYPDFDDYEAWAGSTLPVMILDQREP